LTSVSSDLDNDFNLNIISLSSELTNIEPTESNKSEEDLGKEVSTEKVSIKEGDNPYLN
jgi:hypothetical protein